MNNIQPASNLIPKPRQTNNNTQKREAYRMEEYYQKQIKTTRQARMSN